MKIILRTLILLSAVMLSSCGADKTPQKVALIPEPVSLTTAPGSYTINPGATIAADTSLLDVAHYMAKSIEKATGLKLAVTNSSKGDITLSSNLVSENEEAYTLYVTRDGVAINGASPRGVIMAIATLQQLLPVNASQGGTIALVNVEDAPRFPWRGMMLDVSRHFYTIDDVKDQLDLMARYKLNKFHWHLTDDQGWRIEIKKYPLLTEKGGWRTLNSQDRQCEAYAKQYDNADFHNRPEFMKVVEGDTLYGGFYTQDQIRDVVAYAAERGIDVIPELDMPGHFMAAMLGYPEISCFGEVGWGASFSSPICPGKDSVLQFCRDIYTEVAALFPYEYMHLGADEVEKTNWKKCPDCQKRMKAKGLKTEEELQAWFVKNMEQHFNSLGKKLMGWDEIIEGGLSPTATITWWRDWAPDAVPHATAQGNSVVMSPCFTLYFDAWESKGTLESVYNFDPILKQLTPEQSKFVMGAQGNLWCETIPTVRRMQYLILPRLLALSEICWTQPSSKDWESFKERFIAQVEYFDAKGINYRIPDLTGFSDINVFTDTATVSVVCMLPEIKIRYTTDGSFPNNESTLYTGPITISETTNFTFRGFRPDNTGGEMYKAEYRKESYAPAVDAAISKDGIKMSHYGFKGKKCADITKAPFKGNQVVDSVCIPQDMKGWMGLIYDGYIDIPSDGIYTLSLMSNDGSILYVDDAVLIDNDGPHGNKELVAQKALGKGLHKIRVEFFEMNNGGEVHLKMKAPGETELKSIKNFKH